MHSIASGIRADATINCDCTQHVGKKVLEGMAGKTTAGSSLPEAEFVIADMIVPTSSIYISGI